MSVNLEGKRYCYYVPHQMDEHYGQFIPSIVVENEAGHSPMTGSKSSQTPWLWGTDRTVACKAADDMNRRLGVTEEQADVIIASSMRALPPLGGRL